MARSLRNGDFDLVLAIQSPSSPDRWYRVLLDRARALAGGSGHRLRGMSPCHAWLAGRTGG